MRGDSDFSPDVCVGQGVGVGNLEGGLSFYLGSPAARRAGCGAAKVPGGGGASAAAAAPPGPLPTAGRGVRTGSAGAPRKNPTPKQINKKITRKRGETGRCCAVEPRARRCGSGQSGSAGPEPRRVPAAPRAPRAPPGSPPGPAPRKVGPALRPLRVPAAADGSGDERSAFWRSVVSCY